MNNAENISGIKDIINNYDTYILDQWGVMHDGDQGYSNAISCVKKLYELKKKKLIIISNSSKRKNSSISKLPKLGYNKDYFYATMTSGEMIWQSLIKSNYDFTNKSLKNCFHIYDESKEDGEEYREGLEKFNFVKKIEDSDFILGCTPFANSKITDYIPFLSVAIKNKLPFVCANPDFETVVNNSKELVFCMGTVAELYKNMGGEVYVLGKPNIEIYIEATKKISNLNIDKSRILAIGDSLFHDIAGANTFGVDSLLITSGVHYDCFDPKEPKWQLDKNKLQNFGIKPTFICSNFQY